jgi:hypothetical protein
LSLLRASGNFSDRNFDLGAVVDGSGPSGVRAAADLIGFADAAIGRDEPAMATRRAKLVEVLGPLAMIDAAAVIGGFDGITRIADATGIPLEPAKAGDNADFIAALGIDRFRREKV